MNSSLEPGHSETTSSEVSGRDTTVPRLLTVDGYFCRSNSQAIGISAREAVAAVKTGRKLRIAFTIDSQESRRWSRLLLSSLAIKSLASCRRDTVGLRHAAVIFGSIVALASPAAHAASSDNLVLGSWQLNVAKSRFTPGPGWRSQIRIYQATPQGIAVNWTGVDAKGEKMQVSYAYAYDGRDYPMLGSASYDTLNAVRVNERTVRSEEKRDGKTVGIAVRTISPDGKVLTITDEGTNRKGQRFSQLLVFDRQ